MFEPATHLERALIVRREHLCKIFDSGKIWEMRSSKTKVRGKIGLIESGSGLIVGEAILTDCGNALSESMAASTKRFHQVADLELLKKWKYPWILEAPKRYVKPIPYDHPKGAVIWVRLNR